MISTACADALRNARLASPAVAPYPVLQRGLVAVLADFFDSEMISLTEVTD